MWCVLHFHMHPNFRQMIILIIFFNNSKIIVRSLHIFWPPLWSSGQSFWLQIQRSWVRCPALPDFLRSSGSGTGSTQPREDNWGARKTKLRGFGPLANYLEEIVAAPLKKIESNDRGDPLRWPRKTLYPQKLALLRQQAAVTRSA
jgi:hypothetical protein